jgi:hypothetical protein
VEAALKRCRVLAGQIESKLRHKRPERFVDEFSLADLYARPQRSSASADNSSSRSTSIKVIQPCSSHRTETIR